MVYKVKDIKKLINLIVLNRAEDFKVGPVRYFIKNKFKSKL